MKKIAVAVLAAAMLAGTVTAADISFAYKGSNYAGVVVDFDSRGVEGNDDYKSVKYDTASNNKKPVGFGFVRDEYYGWMNFALPLGSLQVTAGRWSGRNVNRVLADVLPGTLMAKVGLAQYSEDDDIGSWQPDADGRKKWHVDAGFLGEVSYWQEGPFRATLSARALNKNLYSFGAWISPEVGDALQMTIGGTVATGKICDDKTKEWTDRKNEWGVDFRLRLQVNDDLSLTTMNNISSGYDAKGKEMADGKDGNVGKMWNMVNATYRFADNLKASFTLQSVADVLCPHYDERDWNVIVSPSLIIQASEQARVTTSLRASMNDIRDYALKNIVLTVPVIFSFNY